MTSRISVFGLGYVGCVSAACFAKEGHEVVGVDVNQSKVDMINQGISTIVEHGIGDLRRGEDLIVRELSQRLQHIRDVRRGG